MERSMVQVYKPVKNILKDLKNALKVKNESEVIAYLYGIYEEKYPKLTVIEHEKALKKVEEIHSQGTI